MNPARRLGEQLRLGHGGYLAARRAVAALSLTTIFSMALVTLYQLGLLKRLPQPPSRRFTTKNVHASAEAYSLLAVPDAVLGLGSYAATLGLAAMGGEDRVRTRPWIPLAFSIYSVVASACTLATLALVIPEAAAAVKSLRR